MTRDAFLDTLGRGLEGLPREEIAEIISDYSAHFAESEERGRSEAEVASALGDPARIARELRADIGVKRLEAHWSLRNLFVAATALAGLAIIDLIFLLPLLILTIVLVAGFAAGVMAVGAAGLKVIATTLFSYRGEAVVVLLGRLSIGAGLVSGCIGSGALLLMGVGAGVRALGHYARLHFRLARPGQNGAGIF